MYYEEKNSTKKQIENKMVFDFITETQSVQIIAGFQVVSGSGFSYTINVMYLILIYIIVTFLLVMSIITMVSAYETTTCVTALHIFSLILVSIYGPTVRYLTKRSLMKAHGLIMRGIFNYDDEEHGTEFNKIRNTTIGQGKLYCSYVVKISLVSAILSSFMIPLMNFLFEDEGPNDPYLNYYLPLRLRMPFSTKTFQGYGIAFISQAMFWVFIYCVGVSIVATYMGCAYELIAETEILLQSINSIEKRALQELRRKGLLLAENFNIANDYINPDFQTAMYSCLRRNIMHHQAIIRLQEAMSPFMEGEWTLTTIMFSLLLAVSIIQVIVNPNINFVHILGLVSEVYGYLQFCNLSETIMQRSSKIRDALYSTPWYMADMKYFSSTLQIMLTRTIKPLAVSSRGIHIPASLKTFSDTMALGYKLINLLITLL